MQVYSAVSRFSNHPRFVPKNALTQPSVGPSKDFYYAIMQGVSDMLENDQTVEETVEIMSDEMQNLLTEYARNNAVA